jgi:hypothetical protein
MANSKEKEGLQEKVTTFIKNLDHALVAEFEPSFQKI